MRGPRAVIFPVSDLQEVGAFYASLLGAAPVFEDAASTVFDIDGVELVLSLAAGDAGVRGAVTHWGVRDVPEALDRALSLGAKLVQAPTDLGGGVVVATVQDPGGNALGFIRNPDFRSELGSQVAAVGQQMEEPIVRTERVPARAREVFAAWTTSDGMSAWLTEAHIELRLGGAFELYFDRAAPPGLRGSEGCRILAYHPPRFLAFTWNAPPHLSTRGQRTWVLLEITDRGRSCDVTLTHTGWPRVLTGDWLETYVYFEAAWTRVLQALSRHFGG